MRSYFDWSYLKIYFKFFKTVKSILKLSKNLIKKDQLVKNMAYTPMALTATFYSVWLEKTLCFANIIKHPVQNFRWFKETFTWAPTGFLKTKAMISVWNPPKISLKFLIFKLIFFYMWPVITKPDYAEFK